VGDGGHEERSRWLRRGANYCVADLAVEYLALVVVALIEELVRILVLALLLVLLVLVLQPRLRQLRRQRLLVLQRRRRRLQRRLRLPRQLLLMI